MNMQYMAEEEDRRLSKIQEKHEIERTETKKMRNRRAKALYGKGKP